MVERWRLTVVALLGLALLAGSHAEGLDAAAAEARQLSALGSTATRHGLRLQLRAANGRVVDFESLSPQDDEHELEVADYRLTGVSPDGKFFVVHGVFYESASTYWVSRATGEKTEFYATPAVSPNGRFAVVALDTESSGAEGVFVWEIAGDQLVQRTHLKNGDYGLFTFKRWLGNNAAELALYSHSHLKFCAAGAQSTTATVRLTRNSQGWTLSNPSSAREVRCE